jgi:hypothetical protein
MAEVRSDVSSPPSGQIPEESLPSEPPILQPMHAFYDPDAERVSNLIDEELKVCHTAPPVISHKPGTHLI